MNRMNIFQVAKCQLHPHMGRGQSGQGNQIKLKFPMKTVLSHLPSELQVDIELQTSCKIEPQSRPRLSKQFKLKYVSKLEAEPMSQVTGESQPPEYYKDDSQIEFKHCFRVTNKGPTVTNETKHLSLKIPTGYDQLENLLTIANVTHGTSAGTCMHSNALGSVQKEINPPIKDDNANIVR